MEEIIQKGKGEAILLGNEAVVRGALEAGAEFVSTYPGTPASEIGNTFFHIAKKAGVYFEFSTNEKVAMEAAAGAAFCGQDSMVAMKNFGLNVASDIFLPLCYTGTKGALVVVVADDPGCWSSAQSEENSRAYAQLAHVPILEPSDPQECKDFVKLAFDISRKFQIPVMVRLTTRVSHQRGIVALDKLKNRKKSPAKFVKDPKKFITMPPRVLEMKGELLDKIKQIRRFAEESKVNRIENPRSGLGGSKLGIITSGVSYLYAIEAQESLGLTLSTFKLGFFHPLPERKLKNFLKKLKKVLIVEELEPYLEREIKLLAKEIRPKLQVLGKDCLSEVGELKPEYVIDALAELKGKKQGGRKRKLPPYPVRKPQLCPGCPYGFVFSAIKKAVDPSQVIFGGDIGCYMMAGLPPHLLQDYLFCMGSSLGIAHGIKKTSNQKLIAFIGDSTFFHAGIPALINITNNQSAPLIIVMNNQTTAMTGHQPHPGTAQTGMGEPAPKLKIESIVRACQIKHIKVIDQIDQKEMIKTIKDFLKKKEASVIIARRPCVFVKK